MTPEVMHAIDSINVTMNAGGMNTINIVLAFVMYGVALGIKPKMFIEVFSKPKSVILGMCSQLILLPLFTFLLALALGSNISWTMAMGMILVASCPGGNISNFMSSLSKANIELSVSLTAISTALAVIMTPFNFWLYGNLYLEFSNISSEVPQLVIPLWDVFKTIFILLGVPLTLGILTSQYLPKLADKLKKPLQWFSLIFFIAMVVLTFVGNIDAFLKSIKYIFIVYLSITFLLSQSASPPVLYSRFQRKTAGPLPSRPESRTADSASYSSSAPRFSAHCRLTVECSSSPPGGVCGISSAASASARHSFSTTAGKPRKTDRVWQSSGKLRTATSRFTSMWEPVPV